MARYNVGLYVHGDNINTTNQSIKPTLCCKQNANETIWNDIFKQRDKPFDQWCLSAQSSKLFAIPETKKNI